MCRGVVAQHFLLHLDLLAKLARKEKVAHEIRWIAQGREAYPVLASEPLAPRHDILCIAVDQLNMLRG
jgi:hypothetical protein